MRFYLRGEEYSAQIDDFVAAVRDGTAAQPERLRRAAETDRTIALMLADRARRAGRDRAAGAARAPRRRRALVRPARPAR